MIITDELDAYIDSHIDPEPPYLHDLMRRSNLRMVHGRMCSGHQQGRLLRMLARISGARRILELGTFTGYATLCLAEAAIANSEDSDIHYIKKGEPRVDTIEIFDENEDFLREAFAGSPYVKIINLIIGDAIDVMPNLEEESYDLIFMDADKRLYPDYYPLAKRLLRRGGLILADNTLWDGHVADPERHDRQTTGVKHFNKIVAADPEVERIIIPMRDGLTIIRKR